MGQDRRDRGDEEHHHHEQHDGAKRERECLAALLYEALRFGLIAGEVDPVTSAAMPPDALHRAIATAIRSVIETPARLALPIDVICCWINFCTSSGSAFPKSRT